MHIFWSKVQFLSNFLEYSRLFTKFEYSAPQKVKLKNRMHISSIIKRIRYVFITSNPGSKEVLHTSGN